MLSKSVNQIVRIGGLVTKVEFEKLVAEALVEFPKKFAKYLDNVEVTVSDWPDPQLYPRGLLFGLYQGIPKTKRGANYTMVLPDKITIFQGPMELVYKEPEQIKAQVKKTVLHEIAHHFGLSDGDLRKIGY